MSDAPQPSEFTRRFVQLMNEAIQHFGSVTRENEQEVTRWVQVRLRDRQPPATEGRTR